MSNPTGQVASATSGFPESTMPNVIDALKRLERIGSEHSETTRKIVEAATELSNKIDALYPSEAGDDLCIVQWESADQVHGSATQVQGFSLREMRYSLRRPNRIGRRKVHNDRLGKFVDGDREAALQFAADIARNFLEEVEKNLQKRLSEDQEAWSKIQVELKERPS